MANQRAKASRDVRAGRVDVQKGVHQLTRSVKHIELSLRRAERKIEAATPGIGFGSFAMRQELQLAVLRRHQREASRILTRLSTAAHASRGDLRRAADRALNDARKVSDSMIARFRRAVTE